MPASVQFDASDNPFTFLFWCFIQFLILLCLSLWFLPLVSVSVTEYFPAAEAQKGWGHLGREIVTS